MRPSPEKFAQWSYSLAYVSAGITLLVFLLALIPGKLGQSLEFLQNIIWALFFTGAIGTFFGYAARTDLKTRKNVEEAQHKARIGLRTNAMFLGIIVFIALFAIVGRLGLIPGIGF
jgi:hypothetical protein